MQLQSYTLELWKRSADSCPAIVSPSSFQEGCSARDIQFKDAEVKKEVEDEKDGSTEAQIEAGVSIKDEDIEDT